MFGFGKQEEAQPKQEREAMPEKTQEDREQIDHIYQDENALYWCKHCGNLYRPCSHIILE